MMALTGEHEQQLQAASLVDFFNKNKKYYKKMAQASYDYVSRYMAASGLQVRVDDVAQGLVPALLVDPRFTEQLSRKRLRQKYWFTYFADLVLDRFWEELT